MNRLRSHRKAAGLTQPALADRAGVSKDNVCRIEGGARPSYETAVKIATVLGCQVGDIWPGCVLRGLISIPARDQEVTG